MHSDKVSAISYSTGKQVDEIAVGDHPQRMRLGFLPEGWTAPQS